MVVVARDVKMRRGVQTYQVTKQSDIKSPKRTWALKKGARKKGKTKTREKIHSRSNGREGKKEQKQAEKTKS